MPAFGLTILSLGAVLLYCAIKDISVADFFRGLVTGIPAKPRPDAGNATPPSASGGAGGGNPPQAQPGPDFRGPGAG